MSINKQYTPTARSAQLGYTTERFTGFPYTNPYIFFEVKGTGIGKRYYIQYNPPPVAGSTPVYELSLDANSGVWAAFVDSVGYGAVQNDYWVINMGTNITFNGEIRNLEDKMPGSASNPCEFRQCGCLVAGAANYIFPTFDNATNNTTDPAKFGCDNSPVAGSFQIYQK